MASDTPADRITLAARPSTLLPQADRARILLYGGMLVALCEFGAPFNGLIDVPVVFFLKNRLHLSAHEIARFRLLAALPIYLSFVFGFARDRFNPLGLRDRGFLIVFGGLTAALYAALAFTPVSYATLLVGIVIVNSAFLLVSSAQQGLLSTLGQQHAMSGQISAVWNVFLAIPLLTAFLIGGLLSDRLEGHGAAGAARILFLAGAAVMSLVAVYGLWKPGFVFANLRAERPAAGSSPRADLGRLARHWPIYPALTIWFLWEFAPGTETVLQYYLSNALKASDAVFGEYSAIYLASFIPTYLVFGLMCRRVPLRALLWWGTLAAVPQMIPLIFIHSAAGALFAAVPIGLMGGVATAAYMDLVIRACPPGLQGTTLMLSTAVFWLAIRLGDLWGTDLYDHHGGFVTCALVTTAVYAAILPVLLLVPRGLIATRDGEVSAAGRR